MWVEDGMKPQGPNPELSEDTTMSMVDAFLTPETFQGPYSEFYSRAITELLCWRMLSDETDNPGITQEAMDPLAFDALGIQLGQA